MNELLSIRKGIEKGTYANEQLESEIMAKLQDQRLSSKVAKHFSQLAEKLRNRKSDLVWHPPLGGQGRRHWSNGSPAGLVSDFVLVSGLH